MVQDLAQIARHVDEQTAQARAELVNAVRQAAARGITQQDIAQQIGRSQPEVSRLLHFHGTSPLARILRRNATQVRRIISTAGGARIRVFGSVATGRDRSDSDVDLLFDMKAPLSLMQLGQVEQQLSQLLGVPVDLVPESALRPDLREHALAEAVAL